MRTPFGVQLGFSIAEGAEIKDLWQTKLDYPPCLPVRRRSYCATVPRPVKIKNTAGRAAVSVSKGRQAVPTVGGMAGCGVRVGTLRFAHPTGGTERCG